MKLQFFTIVAGSILLVSPALSKMVVVQNTASPAKIEHVAEWKQLQQSLNLTDAQKATLKQIRESAKTQMDAVLTDVQKAQPKADWTTHKAEENGKEKGHTAGQTHTFLNTLDLW